MTNLRIYKHSSWMTGTYIIKKSLMFMFTTLIPLTLAGEFRGATEVSLYHQMSRT